MTKVSKKEWTLDVYASGGGGHKVAAEAKQKAQATAKIRPAGSLKPCRDAREVIMIDVMNSYATFLPSIGRACTEGWNKAQEAGDIKKQRKLVGQQWLADRFFFISAFVYFVLQIISRPTLPTKIIVTQPLMLSAMVAAVRFVNFFQPKGMGIKKIDLYMTDFPTNEAIHFFGALKRNVDNADMIKVHAPAPSRKDLEQFGGDTSQFWEFHTGIKNLNVKITEMPINAEYKKANLPLPGEACTLEVKAQVPKEKEFLGVEAIGQTKKYEIAQEDQVGIVMLGSQPTHQSIEEYVLGMIAAAKTAHREGRVPEHTTYLFVATGPKDKNMDKKGLYARTIALVEQHQQALSDANVEIVPFTGQPAMRIMGRADKRWTRSGGLTTAEHLEMKKREMDRAQILIHTQEPENFKERMKEKLAKGLTEDEAEQAIRNEENPLWEGGNAKYLRDECRPGEVRIVGSKKAEKDFLQMFFPELEVSLSDGESDISNV